MCTVLLGVCSTSALISIWRPGSINLLSVLFSVLLHVGDERQTFPSCTEVNASPSLSTDTAADHKLKFQMVDDCLTLVDVEGHFQGRLPSSYGGQVWLSFWLVERWL